MMDIDIIGACSDLGVHVDGASLAPIVLEKNVCVSSVHRIVNVNTNHVKKEVDRQNLKKNLKEINEFNARLYQEVLVTLNYGNFPLILGGDHSIAIASALASIKKYNNLGIIWFDAHGDFNTFSTTRTGNIHGLPFAAICNYEKESLTFFHNGEFYNPKNAVLVGARDIDEPGELQNLKDAGVTIFTTEDIKLYGVDYIYGKAFEIAGRGTNGIHISYDLDVIDPIFSPGVSVPAKNGINLDEAYLFLDYIIKNKNQIRSMDLIEFNPMTDYEYKTEKIALNIMNRFLEEY